MEYSPRIDNVIQTLGPQVLSIESRSLLDAPLRIAWIVPTLQFLGALDGQRVKVKRHYGRTEATRRKGEEAATRPDVQKRLAFQIADLEHAPKGFLSARDSRVIEGGKEPRPVCAEPKS